MISRMLCIISLLSVVVCANSAWASNWTDANDLAVTLHLWSDEGNWDDWVPEAGYDTADIRMTDPNMCIINAGTTAAATVTYVGFAAPGHLVITGGTLNSQQWRVGSEGGGGGIGLVTMSGGAVTLTADSAIGQSGGEGTLDMTGGTINHTAGVFIVGFNGGSGTFNLNDPSPAAALTTVSLRVGYENGGRGTVTVTDGNIVTKGDASVGQGNGSVGTLNIDGGIVNQTTGWFYVGYQGGIGTVNLNGGKLSTPHIQLGTVAGASDAPVPLIDLRGGTLEIRNSSVADVEFQILAYYVPRGWIKAYGGAGTISLTWDPVTTWAIVEGVPPCWWDMPGDVNKDCTVDLVDFAMLAEDWLVTVAP